MQLRPVPTRTILLTLAAVLGWATPAFAQSLWSLAGTFNEWHTDDPEWTMSPLPGASRDDVLMLDHFFDEGQYEFKFVRDGSWDNGHFGASDLPRRLEEPGENIRLSIHAPAVYRIILDERRGTWLKHVVKIESPVLIVETFGVAQRLKPLTIDYSKSVTLNGLARATATIILGKQRVRTMPVPAGAREFLLRPEVAGPLDVTIRLTDDDQSVEEHLKLNVEPFLEVRYLLPGPRAMPEQVVFEPRGPSSFRALLNFPEDIYIEFIQVETSETILALAAKATIPAGSYVIDVEDGQVRTHDNPELPDFMHPGNWHRFTYVARESVDAVHLIGAFNDWAEPGTPNAIKLFGQWDHAYTRIIDVPEGSHRYLFLIDGQFREHDRRNKQTERGEDGTLYSITSIGKLPGDFPAPLPDDINLDAVRHNPVFASDFAPVSDTLGLADISLRTLPGDAQAVTLHITSRNDADVTKRLIELSRSTDTLGYDRWSTRVKVDTGQWDYQFVMTDGDAEETLGPFEQTVQPGFDTPDWAKGVVWYQIFAERFRNGNSSNDPNGPGIYQTPWSADWYKVSESEEMSWRERFNVPPGKAMPPRKGGSLYHVVWDRRYGGDLQGVLDKLDHLVELGVGAIYFNPIFEAQSMHKYDATDYRHIDDNFGSPGSTPEQWSVPEGETSDPATWTWTGADRFFVDEFLPACKQRGLRVVLDGVFNHTGRDFFAFKDIEEKGEASPYKDWFICQFDTQGALTDWESWFNTRALPNFREDANGLVEPVKQHIFDITSRWMDPNGDGDPSDGIDGWRLDVALDVALPFWKDWRTHVKGINPEAIIIAEIWGQADAYTRGNYFDTAMHYPFARAVTDWLGVRPGMTSSELGTRLEAAFNDAPQTNLIHQNLFGSHDTDRFVSMLQNPNREYDQGNRIQDHAYPYNDSQPSERTYKLSLLGVAIQATYLGAPMIYAGDELGMWGADDPTDRKPLPWPDLGPMDNEAESARLDILAAYQHWFGLRRDEIVGPILRLGSVTHLDTGNPNVFAFGRELNGLRVIVVVNRGDKPFDASDLLAPGDGATSLTKVDPLSAAYWLIEH